MRWLLLPLAFWVTGASAATPLLAQSAEPFDASVLQSSLQQPAALTASRFESSGLSDSVDLEQLIDERIKAREEEKEKEAADKPTAQVFGRTHLEGIFFPETDAGVDNFENPGTGVDVEDRIQFRRIRLGVQGDLPSNGLYRAELDFRNPSDPTFRDTYFGFKDMPLVQTLLIGNQKRPLGLDNWHSNTYVIFMERPAALMAFNPNFRRIGLQTYGYSEDESLNWQMGVFELADVKELGTYVGDSLQLSYNARVSGTPWYDEESGGRGYYHWGLSNMLADADADAGPPDSDENQTRFNTRPELRTRLQWVDTGVIAGSDLFDIVGIEQVLNLGPLQVTGEYLGTWVSRNNDGGLFFDGGYVQAAYFLTGEHEPWDRQDGRLDRVEPFENFFIVRRGGRNGRTTCGMGAWQVAARWSYLNLTDDDVRGGREENAALALNWYWTPHSKVIMNVVHGRIDDRAPVNGETSGQFTGVGVRFMMDY